MSIFNEKRWLAFETGKYICAKCGAEMKFTDKWEEELICPKCGHRIELDRYGFDSEEEYDAVYPIIEVEEPPSKEKKDD